MVTFVLLCSNIIIATKPKEVKTEVIVKTIKVHTEYLTRNEINAILQKDEKLKRFYNTITYREIASIIIKEAIDKKVPVNLAFALAFVESNFNIMARSENGKSFDSGLFQLNNKTFPDVEWYDPVDNTTFAMLYLKEKFLERGSWEIAIILYNAGLLRNIGSDSLEHMRKVLAKEKEYDKLFNKFYRDTGFPKDIQQK